MLQNRGIDVSRGFNPDALSPDQMMSGPNQQGAPTRLTQATPTMQQRIKALGVATPIALSSPVRRYVFIFSIIIDKKKTLYICYLSSQFFFKFLWNVFLFSFHLFNKTNKFNRDFFN